MNDNGAGALYPWSGMTLVLRGEGRVTVQIDNDTTKSRRVFRPAQEKPVAIFLPQHRPSRGRGFAVPVICGLIGTTAALAATFAYMMPGSPVADEPAVSLVVAKADEPTAANAAEKIAGEVSAATATDSAVVSTPATAVEATLATVPRPQKASVEIPSADDPRWAKASAPSGAAALAAVKSLMKGDRAETDAVPRSGLLAYASANAGKVPEQDATGDEQTASIDPAASKVKAPEDPAPDIRQSRVNTAVNMRSGPSDENRVILVIPGGAGVELLGCDSWCKVVYEGRTGYIYKSFVGGKSKPRASASRNVQKKKADVPVKTVSVVSTVEESKKTEPSLPNPMINANRGR